MATRLPPIAPEALTWRFSRAGGPGGQHVNKASTRVELECDLARAGFSPTLTERLIGKLGEVVRITVADTRSQQRNREIAEQRLVETLTAAAVVPRRRRPTKPTRGAVEERLGEKRRRGERKTERRKGSSWRNEE